MIKRKMRELRPVIWNPDANGVGVHGGYFVGRFLYSGTSAPLSLACGPEKENISFSHINISHNGNRSRRSIVGGLQRGRLDDVQRILNDCQSSPRVLNFKGGGFETTPLHNASKNGHTEVLEVLLCHGADIEAEDNQRYSPLVYAILEDRFGAVEVLLRHGAKVDSEAVKGAALWKASCKGKLDEVQSILNGCQSNPVVVNFEADWKEITPLHMATINGHTAVIELLLSHGAEVNTTDKFGYTPLVYASQYGRTEVMEILLLYHGARIEPVDCFGRHPLIEASMMGHSMVIELLLSHGAEVNYPDNDGMTPIMFASQAGQTEAMKVLMLNGADFEKEDVDGRTSLVCALSFFRIGAVEVLLRHGAQVNWKIRDQDIPLILALRSWDTSAMKDWLYRSRDHYNWPYYNQGETLLQWAMRNNEYHFMNLLLRQGVEILEARDNDGMTPLSWASQNDRTKSMEVLLHHGAQVDSKDNMGMTPLALASQRGHVISAKILLDVGASVRLKDEVGQLLPLDHALLFLCSGQVEHNDIELDKAPKLSTVYLLLKEMYTQRN